MKISIRKEAEKDLEEIYEWYELKKDGLGKIFLKSFENALTFISFKPKIYPNVNKNVRRAFIKGFPFGVFYFESEKSIIIFAVLHARKSPSNWQDRI